MWNGALVTDVQNLLHQAAATLTLPAYHPRPAPDQPHPPPGSHPSPLRILLAQHVEEEGVHIIVQRLVVLQTEQRHVDLINR